MTGTSSTAPFVAFKSKEVGDHDSAHNTENAVNSIEGRPSNSKHSQFSMAEGTAERWETLDEAKRAKKNVLETSKRLGLKGGKGNKKEKANHVDQIERREGDITIVPLSESGENISVLRKLEGSPGANTLGPRIQSILSSVSPFFSTLPTDKLDGSTTPEVPAKSPIFNSNLLTFLSSTSIMNGDQDSPSTQQDRRMSVWNVLDRMVPYSQPSRGLATPSGDNNQTPEPSIMLYAPIIPDENSQVTLAKSKLMKVEAAENVPLLPRVVAKSVFSALWPQEFKLRYGKKDGGAQASVKIMLRGRNEECSEVKVWIPSGTALSLQVTWWGYRIWLPPPAMSILGDKTVVATQQAAMLTASLTWITSNVPLIVLAPHLGAVLGLLRALVPILGDVGLFVASRWDQIKSFDKGQGVVLSATWLAPMALTPSSWTDSDYDNDIASVSGRAASTLVVIPLPQSGALDTSTPATGYSVKPGQPEYLWTPDKKLVSKL